MNKDEFILKGAVLTVLIGLGNDNIRKLSLACTELLNAESDLLVIDLSAVKDLTSTNIGILADTHFRAQELGKKLTIKVPVKLLREFEATCMNEMLDIELA